LGVSGISTLKIHAATGQYIVRRGNYLVSVISSCTDALVISAHKLTG